MKLKKLEITGFKSFYDKSKIDFPHGISAIVGPNGCGKSNIVDALRWVMGEQSVKQLRGKAMEDVIFAGANGKAALNMAEVSLTLENDNGSAPEELKDFTEIMLTRRLYRSGESAYFLNKRPCRLKDIHNVFLGSGVGTKSYAFIQQGNIGAIIDAGPDERRYFIEEAAGTTRFKTRKNEALRKVKSTNQNLLRVSDIIAEIKRQMAGLKRQARKAERYKLHQGRIRELDIRLNLINYTELSIALNETDGLLNELKDQDVGHTSRLKQLDSAVEDIKLKRWQKNQEISKLKSRKFDLVRNIDKTENDLNHLRQEIDRLKAESAELQNAHSELEDKNRKIRSEIDTAENENQRLNRKLSDVRGDLEKEQSEAEKVKTRYAAANQDLDEGKALLMDRMAEEARYKNIYQNASNNRENLQRRIKRAEEQLDLAQRKVDECRKAESKAQADLDKARKDVADFNDQLAAASKKVDEKRKHLADQVKKVQTLAFERNNANTRHTAMRKMEENFEWYRDGVKAIMKAEQFDTIIGLLADVIEPETDYQTAVEAALGESLQYILVNDEHTGAEAIQYLQSANAGRSGFIPMATVKNISNDRRKDADSNNSLLQHIKIKAGYEKIVDSFLGHVVVANDIDHALNDFNHNGARLTIVTKEGDLISRQGIMIGGSKDKLSGILAKKQEIKDLERRIAAHDRSLISARQTQEEMESEVRQLETDLQKTSEQLNISRNREVDAEKQYYRISEELKHALRHLEVSELEQEQLLGEESDIDDEIANCNSLLTQLTEDVETQKKAVSEKARQVELVNSELEGYSRNIVDLKLNLTTLNARLEHSNNTLRRLREFLDDGRERFEQIAEDIIRKNRKAASSEEQIGQFESQLTGMYAEMKLLERNLDANESDYSNIDAQLKNSDAAISEITGQREKLQEKVRLLEIEQTQRSVQRDNIANRLEEKYGRPFAEYRKEIKEIIEEAETSTEAMGTDLIEEELEHLRNKIARIGDVNLGAINEYETLKSRYDFLCEQREDLHKAIDALHKVINKINRITQQRFLETFNLVNEKLKEVFPRLFEGGTARLVLTDPQNPLETGVEYMVHPPGKKLTRMSLLSGGEKALSAIAFIFSLFLMKPTAFCLMDEIDAPLDDANVYRFNDLLKLIGQKSQIVLVTHNKRSMEFADTLFGITMESKGVSKIVSVNLN